ncbi:hypothetical protein AVEN_70977-1 [Araneus ventricosus]|uniref:RNA-directed DNA polymerase from mobile element jockey n=1 Tax=Araneus ventricosus TaxID=182803 RepID=A0A4Y2KQ98_ARAVE|nr:hypothetical protein AVEN_70977-1 [Araneus ventricosus]
MSNVNKLLIYKSILRPLITYAVPIWGIAATVHISKLESLQNITLRQISKMPWFVRNNNIRQDLKILPFWISSKISQHPSSIESTIWTILQSALFPATIHSTLPTNEEREGSLRNLRKATPPHYNKEDLERTCITPSNTCFYPLTPSASDSIRNPVS